MLRLMVMFSSRVMVSGILVMMSSWMRVFYSIS